MTALNPVTVQSLWTVFSTAIFVGVVAWTLSRRAARDFREAERLPFLDDSAADAQAPVAGEERRCRLRRSMSSHCFSLTSPVSGEIAATGTRTSRRSTD